MTTGVRVGDQLTILERAITLTDMVAYAGATWDWHRLHYDPAYIAERGLAGPLVDGQALGAYLCEQLLDEFGPTAWVRHIAFQFKSMVFAGETIRCAGVVTNVSAQMIDVEQSINVGDRLCVSSTAIVQLRTVGAR